MIFAQPASEQLGANIKPARRQQRLACASGQAALESLIVMFALIVLWAGISWLGRIQDLALQASHSSRYAAFAATRVDEIEVSSTAFQPDFLSDSAHQWRDQQGDPIHVSVYRNSDVNLSRDVPMDGHRQIGGADPRVAQLRKDWGSADKGVLSAQVSLIPFRDSTITAGQLLRLTYFDDVSPLIRRQTSILTGAAHSSSDTDTAIRIANSDLAWVQPAGNSYRIGRQIESVASRVDAAWGRPAPVFDWLKPWADQLPEHHIGSVR